MRHNATPSASIIERTSIEANVQTYQITRHAKNKWDLCLTHSTVVEMLSHLVSSISSRNLRRHQACQHAPVNADRCLRLAPRILITLEPILPLNQPQICRLTPAKLIIIPRFVRHKCLPVIVHQATSTGHIVSDGCILVRTETERACSREW